MKHLFLFSTLMVLAVASSFSQNKKAEKEAEAKKNYDKALIALEMKEYVIIVDSYEAGNGIIETNTDVANFFANEKEYIILQGNMVVGSTNPHKMTVNEYNQETDKKGNVTIDMELKGSLVTAKAEIFMKKGGNYADVVITTTNRGTKRFSGEVIPRSESKYFKRPGEV
jgi:hypothetical protein